MITSVISRSAFEGPMLPTPGKAQLSDAPTFHEFASEWLDRQKLEGGRAGTGLSTKSKDDLEWRLTRHLIPAFGSLPINEITVRDVDHYRLAKVRDQKLRASSINKTLVTLAAILEVAVEYELIERNPARGRRRRLPSSPSKRSWLDRADHIAALLNSAGVLDEAARVNAGQRRALLSTLIFAGLRIGEALTLRWQDVDLTRGTISVRAAKTDAGLRTVNLLPVRHGELTEYWRRQPSPGETLVFGTSNGRRQDATNVRRRVLAKAVQHANVELRRKDLGSLPVGLTPHSLRRTFASLLFSIGETPPYVMAQMGHTSPNLTLAIYARQMDRRDGERDRLLALVEARVVPKIQLSDELVD